MVNGPPRMATLLEALSLLFVARLLQLLCFRVIAPWMMRAHRPGARTPSPEVIGMVSGSIASATKIVPWTGGCLPDAMAGKLMLALRGYEATIHLGVTKSSGPLRAHAWLEAAGATVTGETGMDDVVAFPARRG